MFTLHMWLGSVMWEAQKFFYRQAIYVTTRKLYILCCHDSAILLPLLVSGMANAFPFFVYFFLCLILYSMILCLLMFVSISVLFLIASVDTWFAFWVNNMQYRNQFQLLLIYFTDPFLLLFLFYYMRQAAFVTQPLVYPKYCDRSSRVFK